MKIFILVMSIALSYSAMAQPGKGAGSASPAGTLTPGSSSTSESTAPGIIDIDKYPEEETKIDMRKIPNKDRARKARERMEERGEEETR